MNRALALAAVLLAATACGGGSPARPASGPTCLSGLYWRDAHWVEDDLGTFTQGEELTDEGEFPDCAALDPDGGFATDTYKVEGVPTQMAIAGHRPGSDTYVVYVREGADVDDVARRLAAAR